MMSSLLELFTSTIEEDDLEAPWSPPKDLIKLASKQGTDGVTLWLISQEVLNLEGINKYMEVLGSGDKYITGQDYNNSLWVAMIRKGDLKVL